MKDLRTYLFRDSGTIPNNQRLPVLYYVQALSLSSPNPARDTERLLLRHGWQGTWVNGVFPYWHYHSRGHEVLCCTAGHARLALGGSTGIEAEVIAGDVILLPAGTGHKRLSASRDFLIVGGYPPHQFPDLLTEDPADRRRALTQIPQTALPTSDPIFGSRGPVFDHWLNPQPR